MTTNTNPPASRAREEELQVGDRVIDNDPRMSGRVLVVGWLGTSKVMLRVNGDGRRSWVRKDRIHLDGKPRKSGFNLIAELDRKGGEG